MTQQPQEGFDRSVEEARAWMQAVQERLQVNDNTQGPLEALEARLQETEVCGGPASAEPAPPPRPQFPNHSMSRMNEPSLPDSDMCTGSWGLCSNENAGEASLSSQHLGG